MAGTRALFASIGASIALVAAAALSLLTISAVFAFGGWSDSVSQSVSKPALVYAGTDSPAAGGDETGAVVSADRIVAPAPAPRVERRESRAASDRANARATEQAATSVSASGSGTAPDFDAPVIPTTPDPPAAAPAARKTGDHVRKLGDSLSSTVQNAGTALANATQSLAPPVSTAVQQVLNVVAEIVRRTTDGLGGALDALLPPKK